MLTVPVALPLRRAQYSLVLLPLVMLAVVGAAPGPTAFTPRHEVEPIQDLVNELKARLGITDEVVVTLVEANPLLVSVALRAQGQPGFELSIEDVFLDRLERDELQAIVAHELGHVWIFTHHPFLQTERGANDVALRVVKRDVLERVYAKVWARTGMKGELTRFLGNQ